ncbi:Phosphate regulon sensor protein PhoR (SphS) [hydrothermal vent metagenome]|uniref:histidine kinase n=1 Tax=hydrothermal vent metagenome TaxID=652676 RepID=A0A3B1DIH8_9ZZZZ
MLNKLSIRQKLFFYVSVIFTIFTILILLFQYQREKDFKREQLEITLDNIAELTHNFIEEKILPKSKNFQLLDSVKNILPKRNIRITIISKNGQVLYDSEVKDYSSMENHLHRPEIEASVTNKFGANIRESKTTHNDYYYYAKFYKDYYIRTAAHYNVEVKNFLQVNKLFLIYLISLFLLILIFLHLITKKFGESITKLKNLVAKLTNDKNINEPIKFPNDELGILSNQIVAIYNELKIAKDEASIEKNRLFSHLNTLNEGIAFFSQEKKEILTNKHFIQFLNFISEKSNISTEDIFEVEEFESIKKFVDEQLNNIANIKEQNLPQFETTIVKQNKYFKVKCVFFQDKSFEIVITDTTKLEKRKLIKKQMTSNIAHELKTPVATVIGYLETLQNKNVEEEKKKYFIEKAIAQAKRLSILIEDIALLNNIEEAKEYFVFEPANINNIVTEVYDNLQLRLGEKNIAVNIHFEKTIIVNGNRSLLFSVFYNLFDNTIKYGGENIKLTITNYLEDKDYFYFSFVNSGNSIDEIHLSRIFERFYRVDKGRSRKSGGTGLGLSIVKNAILLHGGEITVRNTPNGGLEFLFTLAKRIKHS